MWWVRCFSACGLMLALVGCRTATTHVSTTPASRVPRPEVARHEAIASPSASPPESKPAQPIVTAAYEEDAQQTPPEPP